MKPCTPTLSPHRVARVRSLALLHARTGHLDESLLQSDRQVGRVYRAALHSLVDTLEKVEAGMKMKAAEGGSLKAETASPGGSS